MALIPYAGKEYDFNPLRAPRQEVLLSYLQGLAPVGQAFELNVRHAMQDLSFRTREAFYNILRDLTDRGLVRRISHGRKSVPGVLVVLRRVEDVSWPV